MIRTIRIYGDPVLEQMCADVTDFKSPELNRLIVDLIDTCNGTDNSAGLAAPQIGILKRVAVVRARLSNPEDLTGYHVLINPRIMAQTGHLVQEEGCLSIPGHHDKIARSESVTVEYQNEDSEIVTLKGTGFLARCLVHEIDHLDGRLFIHYFGEAYCAAIKDWLGRKLGGPAAEIAAEPVAAPIVAEPVFAEPIVEASFVQAQHPDDVDDAKPKKWPTKNAKA